MQRDKNEQEENKSAENHKIAAQRHRDGFFSLAQPNSNQQHQQ